MEFGFEYSTEGNTWYKTPRSTSTWYQFPLHQPHLSSLISSNFSSISTFNAIYDPLDSGMCNDLRPTAAMPNCQQRPTISALMLDVLEPSREVGNTAAAETETAQERNNAVPFSQLPCLDILQSPAKKGDLLCSSTRNKLHSRHLPDPAHWAVYGCGALLQ
jgi:hypothetical protein